MIKVGVDFCKEKRNINNFIAVAENEGK